MIIRGKIGIAQTNSPKNLWYTGRLEFLSAGLIRIVTDKTESRPDGERMIFRLEQIQQIIEPVNDEDGYDDGVFN